MLANSTAINGATMENVSKVWTLEEVHSIYKVIASDPSAKPNNKSYWEEKVKTGAIDSSYPELAKLSLDELFELWALIYNKIHGNISVLADLMKTYETTPTSSVLAYFFFNKWSDSNQTTDPPRSPEKLSDSMTTIPVIPLRKNAGKRFNNIDLNALITSKAVKLTDHFNAMDHAEYSSILAKTKADSFQSIIIRTQPFN